MADLATVLIIEDEVPIRKFLRAGLTAPEFRVVEAVSIAEGVQQATAYTPDVILLDLGLPDGDGIEVVKRVREWSDVPIIILSARGMENDKVQALDLGANDYVTKPFGMPELIARIRAALRTRRSSSAPAEPLFEAGDLRVDFTAREVHKGGRQIHLTPIEYKLLTVLVQNAGKVLTHRHLLSTVWGAAYSGETQYLRVFMGQLRRKLEDDPARPQYLLTESGVGYRFRV